MIVVEGPDMVGKTTLCEALRVEWNRVGESDPGPIAHTMKFGREQSNWAPAHYAQIMTPRAIADRMHMSELVYGHVTRDAPNLSPAQYAMVDGAVQCVGGMVILLWADVESYKRLVDMHHARGEMFDRSTCLAVGSAFADIALMARAHGVAVWRDTLVRVDMECEVTALRDGTVEWADKDFVAAVIERYLELQRALLGGVS